MADAGVARDPGRLPWLEPYRAPSRNKSNRRPGVAAMIGAAGLATVLTLLMRDAPFLSTGEPTSPQASVLLPAPVELTCLACGASRRRRSATIATTSK